jgi:hypothetical protein
MITYVPHVIFILKSLHRNFHTDAAIINSLNSLDVSIWPSVWIHFILLIGTACVIARGMDSLKWVFADWKAAGGKVSAVLSLAFGATSLLLFPAVLSPLAIICGSFSAIRGNHAGRVGLSLGTMGLAGMLFFLTLASS